MSRARRKRTAEKTVGDSSRRARKERRIAAQQAQRSAQPSASVDSTGPDQAPQYVWLIIVFAVMLLVALVRLRVADVPLERDEGEYAYAGQLILQGIPPYQLAYNMKFPGTYYAYSLILALFGQTAWGIHIGLLVVNAATTIVLFFLGRRLIGSLGATIAAQAFAILSLDRWTMGVFAHATHFVILPALAGFLVLLRALDSKKAALYVGAGVLLGTAVLMKQQAIFFLPLAIALVAWDNVREPKNLRGAAVRSGFVILGSAIPFGLICALFVAQGVFGKFWFWTFQYARQYVSEIPLSSAWSMFVYGWRSITRVTLPMWVLAGIGVVLLWLLRWKTEARVFLAGLLVASLLALTPGFFFRQHYFILILPAAALFAGVAVASIERLLRRIVPLTAARAIGVGSFVVVAASYAVTEQEYLTSLPVRELSRGLYGANPFVEAPAIAEYIKKRTKPEDRIAVLGSEPEIYFYANRKSATGYIYTYPLMERQPYAQRMQNEMIREIESVHPTYVVFVTVPTSWLVQKSDEKIITWSDQYTGKCYGMVGLTDIHSFDESAIVWDMDAQFYRPRSSDLVYTFRRTTDAPCAVGNQPPA